MFETLPVCTIQQCDAYMPMSADGMESSVEIRSPQRKILGDSFQVQCKEGYYVDDFSILPGLEALGSVMVLAFAQFLAPNAQATSSTVFALEGLYSAVSISVPPGAWPLDLATGPSAAVFTPPDGRRRSSKIIVGPYVVFAPSNVSFAAPITIACPFNLTGMDEGNLEIRVHKYHAGSQTYTPLPYPVRSSGRRQNRPVVDKERGSVEAVVTIFEPPYVAVATIIPPAPPPAEVTEAVMTRIFNANATAVEEDQDAIDPLFLALGLVGGVVLACCFGGFFVNKGLWKKKVGPILTPEELEEKAEKAAKRKANKKEEKEVLLEKDNADTGKKKNKMEPEDTVVETVEADLVVVALAGEVIEPAEPTKPAAKLRKKTVVKSDVVFAEEVAAV